MYVGRKGFTILKKNHSTDELMKIKKELMVKPKASMVGMGSPKSFPIYRESESKLYIPRYYGENLFGKVLNKLSYGDKINVPFEGTLRDYQKVITDKFVKSFTSNACCGGLLDIDPGKGKTVMALNILSRMSVKTLVIVHKTFLLNQWKERINQFIPSARVGKIQGNTVDIEDKDIVICMLQSVCRGGYSDKIFASFGLTIYDECHHLSAEVFSNCMINIVTNFTVGLSGTMTRKDGLTKVFKWFIGPVMHKEKSKSDMPVLVKSVQFSIADDEDYGEMITNFKGQPLYSSMITKISNNEFRTDFIYSIIEHELKLNSNQQIMLLCHNKSLINVLFEKLGDNGYETGLYLGGMKEEKLKISETKQIVLATYSMASEGLDIKTLTTLIMATPKSDVCQSVGRILRSKHENPLVIDIVDQHDIFQRQWLKRKKYYDSQKYTIKYFKNYTYFGNSEKEHKGEEASESDCGIGEESCSSQIDNSIKPKKCLINFKNIDFTQE